jgi:MFS family permease
MRNAMFLFISGVIFMLAALQALRFDRNDLGPDEHSFAKDESFLKKIVQIAVDLKHAAIYLVEVKTPALALGVVGLSRLFYGMLFICAILISRNYLPTSNTQFAGLGALSIIALGTGIGFALAVIMTPTLSRYIGVEKWIVLQFVVGGISECLLVLVANDVTMFIVALGLGTISQSVKICVDTIVQRTVEDSRRGRTFAIYDVLYNAGFIVSSLLAVVVLPENGYSIPIFLIIAVGYFASAVWYFRATKNTQV